MPCLSDGLEQDALTRYARMLCYCCKKMSYEDIFDNQELYRFYKEHLLMDFHRLEQECLDWPCSEEEKEICASEIERIGCVVVRGKGCVQIKEREQ